MEKKQRTEQVGHGAVHVKVRVPQRVLDVTVRDGRRRPEHRVYGGETEAHLLWKLTRA